MHINISPNIIQSPIFLIPYFFLKKTFNSLMQQFPKGLQIRIANSTSLNVQVLRLNHNLEARDLSRNLLKAPQVIQIPLLRNTYFNPSKLLFMSFWQLLQEHV